MLSPEQIGGFVAAYTSGDMPDYQMSALLMAIFLQGMTAEETAVLTEQMWHSGITLDWPANAPPTVDKHSTGGIGDKTSLILAPLLACCDLQVPMISGRGLGPSGGTLDKLEAIPGFRTDLSIDEVRSLTHRVGCVVTGASAQLAPADRKIYALRDVTATVPSIPLITASIMSKKLAEGLDALVLDVKFGSGAFMKTLPQARELAQSLVQAGTRMGASTTALITDMNQPLGRLAGNAVEVVEAIAVLEGQGPADVTELTLRLAAEVLVMTGREPFERASSILQGHLASGRAREKFTEMVVAQGGDPQATLCIAEPHPVIAEESGFVTAIDTEKIGYAIIEMGGGRKQTTDSLDHATGLETLVRIGDEIRTGQPLFNVFGMAEKVAAALPLIREAIQIGPQPVAPLPLVVERIVV